MLKMPNAILVGIDGSMEPDRPWQNAERTVAAIASSFRRVRVPVWVVGANDIGWSARELAAREKEFRSEASARFRGVLARIDFKGDIEPIVVVLADSSQGAAAHRLGVYRNEMMASAVVLFSHSRSVGQPGRGASFVFATIEAARAPVFVVNHEAPARDAIKTILVATDFTTGAARAYLEALHLARVSGAEIILFHAEAEGSRPSGLGAKWLKRATDLGLVARYEVQKGALPSAALILAAAERARADLIVAATHTGPMAAMAKGSVVRNLIELSPIPILAIRTT